ncbi:menaquinone biosynthesis decarboxylase [Helicobacter jaachi]|uniref:Menaquinone biosynthesis decarboxylase n=1 Tax=Helicobacter jaachi TaxID=1677920 RepID=A0A4U8TBU4_9HELI|nr:menaquinone biosynthesis decarboxylase [Helicobacter jaachi]TLD96097.1 menaquinone biosynthesis decarboxylase [Helicobacter jaachi]
MALDSPQLIAFLQSHNELTIIDEPLDIYLEIPQLAYIEVKKPTSKALLFTRPICKKSGKTFDIPVLMNVFGSQKRLELIVNKPIPSIARHIQNLLQFSPPKGIKQIWHKLKELYALRSVFPKYSKKRGLCQEIIFKDEHINLFDLPILTTWERDGGAFITMGQVYTQNLQGTQKNLGMYRLQVYDEKHLGLHWQIHKDSQHFFHEYKQAKQKMPVSIALGGDPLYIWCGQAPLPLGIFELMLYGFIREHKPLLCQCVTNGLFVPYDVDIVIEGWVDTAQMRDEGPFGDHTGFYTPIEPYPVLEVSAITMRKKPIFPATIVGKPPLEDKYMGYLTERVFLPLLQTTAHGLIDYHMPENGVFHNLIFAKIKPEYPSHSKQIMHNFWGVGQMSFVKHAIFVDEHAPHLEDYEALGNYILERFSPRNVLITEGICDALDHASPHFAHGGKLGIEAIEKVHKPTFKALDDNALWNLLAPLCPQARALKQYFAHSINPICIVSINKQGNVFSALNAHLSAFEALKDCLSIIIFVDSHKNNLDNPYMLTWRIVNNIDAKRDVLITPHLIFIDATDKGACDGHLREWPLDTNCTESVIATLREKGLLQGVDSVFLERFGILH